MEQFIWFVPGNSTERRRLPVRPGETSADAIQRFRREHGQGCELSTPTPAKPTGSKPVPSKTAPVGSREWGACLLEQFGQERGLQFIARELTYLAALDEAIRLEAGAPSQPAEELPKGRQGFASKIRFANHNRAKFNKPKA